MLAWSASKTQPWLSLSAASGTAPYNLTVTTNTQGLAAGIYTDTVTVVADGSTGYTQTVSVTLSLSSSPSTLSLSAVSLAFSGAPGGANPASQAINITDSGSTLTWIAGKTQPWLSLSAASGTTPSSLMVTTNTNGLAAGIYTDTVTISAAGTGSSQAVSVTLNVSSSLPALGVSPPSLTFSTVIDGADPAPQAINITNNGTGTVNWSAGTTQPWLSVSDASGAAPSSLMVTAKTSGLAAGTYTDTVSLASATGFPQLVSVTLNVSSPFPTLSVTPVALTFLGTVDGGNPASQTINITNIGGGTLDWTAVTTQPWLSLSAGSGTAPSSVTVTTNTSGLAAGTYTDTINLASSTGSTQLVTVILNVSSSLPALSVAPESLSFSATVDGGNPASQAIKIANSSGGTLNWTASKTQPWLSLSAASGTAPSSLIVTTNTNGLTAGAYTDTVTIAVSGSTGSPQLVTVTLNLSSSINSSGLISNIRIDSLDTTSFRVFYTVNSPSWVDIRYGTASGVYPYNTKSVKCFDAMPTCQWTVGKGALTISGLTPGTTYYLRVTARPNPDDDTNICATDACGSVEQVVTTIYNSQQRAPIAPATWVPILPDTTNYTVIRLQTSASGECQASANVVSRDGWSVSAGDTVGTILTKIGYGTVIELPQGIKCKVPSAGYTGYQLPDKGPDWTACGGTCAMTDARHRWIVFRTQELNAGDFPPFQSRIDPSFAPKLGKFYSSQPNKASQLFDAENGVGTIHHYWFQNIELADDENYRNPTDSVDPDAFAYFMRLGSQYQAGVNNQFLILDRVYAHGPGAPIRHWQGIELGGNYQAMIGCYTSKIEVSHLTAWPTNPGTLSSNQTVLNIPQNRYRLASNTAFLGMSGPAVVQLANVTGKGTIVGNLYKDHLEIEYTSSMGSVSCSGCIATPTSNPSTPGTALQLFSGSFTAAGGFSGINWNTAEWATSRYPMAFGVVFSDLRAAGGPYYFDDNYLDGVGEGFYIDPNYSDFAHDDVTYTHNHQIWPKNYFSGDPANVWRYNVRQHFEIKRGHRFLLRGNVFSYSWAYQNDGPAILLSGRPTYTSQSRNDGISDIQIVSNQISHLRTPIECSSANSMDNGGGQNEGAVAKRVSITNNLMFDLGRWKHCDSINCPGLTSVYFMNRPGCQDLTIRNNTAGPTYGEIPSLLYVGGGQLQGNSLVFQNNILHFSKGLGGYGGGNVGDWPGNNVANHAIKPAPVYDNYGTAPNFKANLDASFVNIGTTVTPNYSWSSNVLIGGWAGDGPTNFTDLTYAGLMSYASKMPAGDIYPAGDSIAARQAAAGLSTTTWRSSVYNPLGMGADIDVLNADLGRVTAVQSPRATGTSAVFSYMAPDAKACSVDVSADGQRWIRTMDGGGARSRSVTVTGLLNGTPYQSRILCYYQQQNDGVLYTDYSPDQITVATFITQ